MVYFGVDLYRFSLICNDCFRKVVYKKEKGDEQIVLTPSISESNIKFLKISSLFPTEESRKLSMFSVVGCTSTQARTCLTTSYRNRTVSDWGVLRYALPKTVKAPSWELTVPGSF